MRAHPRSIAVVIAGLAAACAAAPQTPVPLAGTVSDLAALTGHWEGAYSSVETGRSGTISFTLTASRDSAFGDVVMIPQGLGRPLQTWNNSAPPAGAASPRSSVLTIKLRAGRPGTRDRQARPVRRPGDRCTAVHGVRRAVARGRD